MNPPPESFDFELTDIDDARRSMEELPPGVREMANHTPGFWESRRRRPLPTDRALTGAAIEWLLSLRAEVRPRVLCDTFPRIVNLIAERWGDHARTVEALQRLLNDDRGGRQGFVPEVEAELYRLLEHAVEQSARHAQRFRGPL